MSQHATVVTTNQHPGEAVVLLGRPGAELVHAIAESFVTGQAQTPISRVLRRTFGRWSFLRYAIDFTGTMHARLTFSRYRNPDTLLYRRGVVAIAPRHAATLEVYVAETDLTQLAAPASHHHTAHVS